MEISEAKIEDSTEISTLLRDTFKQINSKDYAEDQIQAWVDLDSPEEIQQRIRNKELRNFLATENGEIIGYLSLSTKDAVLRSLYIKASKTGQGIGSELLKFAEMLTASHGQDTLSLNASKTAIDFYKKKGYTEKGQISLLVKDIQIPVTQMIKSLN